jgi:hypothetical protein
MGPLNDEDDVGVEGFGSAENRSIEAIDTKRTRPYPAVEVRDDAALQARSFVHEPPLESAFARKMFGSLKEEWIYRIVSGRIHQ